MRNPKVFLAYLIAVMLLMAGLFLFLPASAQQQNFNNPLSLNVAPQTGQPGVLSGSFTGSASAAAIGIATQTVTVTGVTATDMVAVVSSPAPTALCPLTTARATGTNTVSLDFAVLTAVACTPATGTYKFLVIR